MNNIKYKKNTQKRKIKLSKGTNVRLSENGYNTIKNFCDEMGYKIGAFVETASLKRILSESGKA
jgi:hypothetical protein